MAGTFPTAGFTAMELQSNTRSRLTESVSGQTQRIKSGSQHWSFKLKSPPLNRSEFNAIYSFIVQQDGQVEAFTVTPPVISSTTGTASGTVTVNDTLSTPTLSPDAGSTSVGVAGGTGTLKKGDLIKFSNHNKVYMLTEDADLDGSTVDQISFYPPLVETVVGGTTTVTYDDVPFTVFFNQDEVSYELLTDGLYRYEIDVREEL